MRQILMIIVIMGGMTLPNLSEAQPLELLVKSLPVFSAYADIKAVDNVLTIGVYSDGQADPKMLNVFREIRAWSADEVQQTIGHRTIEAVFLNRWSLNDFEGQIIWVMDMVDTLALRKQTEKGVFTISAQHEEYQKYLFATLIYENASDDPGVKKWRLTKLMTNCDISPLRFSTKITKKKYFVGNACDK